MVDVGLKGNEEKILINSYAIFSGLKFKTTSYNHEGEPFYLAITLYYGSINESKQITDLTFKETAGVALDGEINLEESKDKEDKIIEQANGTKLPQAGVPRILITKISPPLYINSRKLAKESNSKKYHTVIEPFDIHSVE